MKNTIIRCCLFACLFVWFTRDCASCGATNADYRRRCVRLTCTGENPAGAEAAGRNADAWLESVAVSKRNLADAQRKAQEAAVTASNFSGPAEKAEELKTKAEELAHAATTAASFPSLRAPIAPMMNYHLARRYPHDDVKFYFPSLVQEKLLVHYFGINLSTGQPKTGTNPKNAPGLMLQAANGAGKTGAMVLGALMRLFPRTTDNRRKELNYCQVPTDQIGAILLTTAEIVPQIYKHVCDVTKELYAGPAESDKFLVFRSSPVDKRLGYLYEDRGRELGHAAEYQKWQAANRRHAHFMVITPEAFRDMLTTRKSRNIKAACANLKCLLIDEVDALLDEPKYINALRDILRELKQITAGQF